MTRDPSTSALTLDGVTKRYGQTTALDRVSLDVCRGEMFGLIGPDGAGKTTTIRLMAGLSRSDLGTLRTLGRDPITEHRALTRRVGYLSQRFSLYGDLSVDENIAFFAEIHGVWRYQARRDRLLELTQLTPFRSRLAERLSGGMKQKLALACTLVHEPDLLLLDEPTTGVDPVSRREFWKLLSEFLEEGLTIVMATPYLDEAERCRRVALLSEGRLLALDDPSVLRANFEGEIFEVIGAPFDRVMATLSSVTEVDETQAFGERMHVRLRAMRGEAGVARLVHALEAAACTDVHVRMVRASLEDVFIELLTRRDGDRSAIPAAGVTSGTV